MILIYIIASSIIVSLDIMKCNAVLKLTHFLSPPFCKDDAKDPFIKSTKVCISEPKDTKTPTPQPDKSLCTQAIHQLMVPHHNFWQLQLRFSITFSYASTSKSNCCGCFLYLVLAFSFLFVLNKLTSKDTIFVFFRKNSTIGIIICFLVQYCKSLTAKYKINT